MSLDILRTILPAATAAAETDADAQPLRETLATAIAVTGGLVVVGLIAVLMGMT